MKKPAVLDRLRNRGSIAWPAMLLLAGLVTAPVETLAHAKLVKSEPVQRAVLRQAPGQLRLWFNENLEPAFCIASVVDASGKSVTTATAIVSSSNRKLLELNLPPLPVGSYRVRFEVLSIDGHTVKSGFKFEIRESALSR